jgi:PhnB protein
MSPVKAIPDNYPRITPYLCINGAEEAIGFYSAVLGAKERMRLPTADGKIGHAELQIGDGLLMVSDEFPDWGVTAPGTTGGSPVTISIYVEDVDTVYAAAIAAGATETMPVTDHFYGDRSGQFVEPFGHKWNVATHIEDVASDEIQRRMKAEFGG